MSGRLRIPRIVFSSAAALGLAGSANYQQQQLNWNAVLKSSNEESSSGSGGPSSSWTSLLLNQIFVPLQPPPSSQATPESCSRKPSAGELFKQRAIGNYENRLRFYAHPLKVYTYFSTGPDSQMTYADFLHCLIPFNEALLTTDIDPSSPIVQSAVSKLSALTDTDNDGSISYEEYLLIVTMLSMKQRQFELMFKVYDTDDSQRLDYKEFAAFLDAEENLVASRMGSRERLQISSKMHLSGILASLFGADGSQTCSFQRFHECLSSIRLHLMEYEFYRFKSCQVYSQRYSSRTDTISAYDFGCAILSFVSSSGSQTKDVIDRLGVKFGRDSATRISFKDFQEFDRLTEGVDSLYEVMQVYSQFHQSEGYPSGLNRHEFKKAVRLATGIDLHANVIEVLFCMFDSNGDGHLDESEFLDIVRSRDNLSLNRLDEGIFGKLKRIASILVS